jgi:CheY-like chemotaxis protein
VDRPASPIVDRVPVSVGARILVADDNRDAADTLALILELDGHEVQKAYDGLEALKLAEEFRPQIALLDIGMPHMDGYQTARRIRDRPWGDSVLLVALTGWGQEQDRRQASEAGFDQHLVKPVDPQAIVSLVEQTRSRR